MFKQFYIIISILLFSNILIAQSDCRVIFEYHGKIKSDSLKIYKIGLPTTQFLIGYITKNEKRAFLISELKDSIIYQAQGSHLSSDFCATTDNIIKRVFKKSKKGYLIKVFTKLDKSKEYNIIEVLIPLESIKFTIGSNGGEEQIEIDLGKLII